MIYRIKSAIYDARTDGQTSTLAASQCWCSAVLHHPFTDTTDRGNLGLVRPKHPWSTAFVADVPELSSALQSFTHVVNHDLKGRLDDIGTDLLLGLASDVLDESFGGHWPEERRDAAVQLAAAARRAGPPLRALRGYLELNRVLEHFPKGELDRAWLDPEFREQGWPEAMRDEWFNPNSWAYALEQELTLAAAGCRTSWFLDPEPHLPAGGGRNLHLAPFVAPEYDRGSIASAARLLLFSPAIEAVRNARKYLVNLNSVRGAPPLLNLAIEVKAWRFEVRTSNPVLDPERTVTSQMLSRMKRSLAPFAPAIEFELQRPSVADPYVRTRYAVNILGLRFRSTEDR